MDSFFFLCLHFVTYSALKIKKKEKVYTDNFDGMKKKWRKLSRERGKVQLKGMDFVWQQIEGLCCSRLYCVSTRCTRNETGIASSCWREKEKEGKLRGDIEHTAEGNTSTSGSWPSSRYRGENALYDFTTHFLLSQLTHGDSSLFHPLFRQDSRFSSGLASRTRTRHLPRAYMWKKGTCSSVARRYSWPRCVRNSDSHSTSVCVWTWMQWSRTVSRPVDFVASSILQNSWATNKRVDTRSLFLSVCLFSSFLLSPVHRWEELKPILDDP